MKQIASLGIALPCTLHTHARVSPLQQLTRACAQPDTQSHVEISLDSRLAVVWRIGLTTSDVTFVSLPSKQLHCVRYNAPGESEPDTDDSDRHAWWCFGLALGQHSVALAHQPGDKMVLMNFQGRLLWQGLGQWPKRDPTGRFIAVILVSALRVLDGKTGTVLAAFGPELLLSSSTDLSWWPSGLGMCCRMWAKTSDLGSTPLEVNILFLALGFVID